MSVFSEEVYDHVLNRTVKHAGFNEIFQRMEHIFRLAKDYERPEGMLIMGPSGVGKTRLLDRFAAAHPDERKETYLYRPIIKITMPPKPNQMALLYQLNLAFGEQYTVGRSHQLLGRAIKMLKQCKTHLIAVDESQHMVRRNSEKDATLAADTIKVILDEAKVSTILSGISEVAKLLHPSKQQLSGRFPEVFNVTPWKVVNEVKNRENSDIDEKNLNNFVGVMMDLIVASGYTGDYSVVSDLDFARRAYFATDGRIRYMSRLVASVMAIVIPTEASTLDIQHFSAAFLRKIYQNSTAESNPFDKKFVERRLILAGEPFWEEIE